jgi:hypothetical protein
MQPVVHVLSFLALVIVFDSRSPFKLDFGWSRQQISSRMELQSMDIAQSSCCKAGVLHDLHGAYEKSGTPRCIGGCGRRSRFVSPSHCDLVALAITGDKFSSNIAFNGTSDRRSSHILEFEPSPGAKLWYPRND